MAASGASLLVFIDDMTADRSNRMNCDEVYRALLSAQIQPIAAKLMGWCFTVQMGNDPKGATIAKQVFLKRNKWEILQSHLHDIYPAEHAFR